MGRHSRGWKGLVKDGHLVNLAVEVIASRVQNTAAADVNIVTRTTVVSRRVAAGSSQNAIVVGLKRSPIGDGRHVMPFEVREAVGCIELPSVGGPDLDGVRINKPILNGIVLADNSDAIREAQAA